MKLDTGEQYRVTIVDAGNPTAFVSAAELNLRGDELPIQFDQDMLSRAKLEAIRKRVGMMMGIPVSESIPKIAFVAPARNYMTLMGNTIAGNDVSMLARVMAMGKMHKTFAITAGIPAAIAVVIPDSVVNEVVAGGKLVSPGKEIVIGHPSGMMDVKVETKIEKGKLLVVSCTIGRTARKIMDGIVYIPRTVYSAGR